jgi:dTDP-4-amino-4,6-dideoxygalactose transaminase
MNKIPFSRPYWDANVFEDMVNEIEGTLWNSTKETGNKISNGDRVLELEEKVAKMSGADYAIACSSCTQGLAMALGASGARGTCYTQSFTWDSTAVAAQMATGQAVRFVEINRDDWSVHRYGMNQSSNGGPCFALAVDTFGTQTYPESLIPLFYDRAHSLGQKFRNLGVASVLSLSPSKIVTGCEGGVILSNKKNFVEAMRTARNLMSRLSEVHAVIALAGLKNINERLEWKAETFEMYKRAFPECQFQKGVSNHQVIGMLFDTQAERDKVFDTLSDRVEFKKYYVPLHFKNKESKPMPVTEEIYNRILCLPSWWNCPRYEIIELVRSVMQK